MATYPNNREELEERLRKHVEIRMTRQGEYNRRTKMEFLNCDFEQKTLEIRHNAIAEEMNPLNTMHGGIVSWLLDSTMGTLANAWVMVPSPTLNLSVNFVSPVREGDEVTVRAWLVHVGRATVSAMSEMRVGDRICATGIGSFFVTENRA